MNISDIKYLYESNNEPAYYFKADTLRFFNQRISDFKVRMIDDINYFFYAPSRWDNKLMGYSQGIFNTVDNKIHDVPEGIKLKHIEFIGDTVLKLREMLS